MALLHVRANEKGRKCGPLLLPILGWASAKEKGREDWITPVSSAQTIAQLLPNAELVIFEESGHSPQTEEREKFNRVVREFVDRVVPASATSPKTK